MTQRNADRVTVRVLITVGAEAELVTPEHTARDPLRVDAVPIAADVGMPVGELPGRRLTAQCGEDGELRDFRLVDDPRL